MSNTREASRLIQGSESTPEQLHKIAAIAHALDIPQNDAMMPILVALESYHGIFSKLPQAMREAAQKMASEAGMSAAKNAQTEVLSSVSTAIHQLTPMVAKAVEHAAHAAADKAVQQAQSRAEMEASVITLALAAFIIGLTLAVGLFIGSGLFHSYQMERIHFVDLAEYAMRGFFVIAVALFGIGAIAFFERNEGWIARLSGLFGFSILIWIVRQAALAYV